MQTGRRILTYLKPYKRRLAVIYVALFGGVVMQLAIPLVLARAIDGGIIDRDFTFLWQAALAIVGLALLQGLFTFVRSFYVNALAEQIGFDLRNELYAKFQDLPFAFYDRAQTGQLMSRATEDVNSIRGMMMMALRALPHAVAMLIGITFILFRTDWLLALVALSTMPLLVFWSVRFGIGIRPLFLKVQQQFGTMTSTLQENVAGGRVVRAFAQEQSESNRFEADLEELFDRELRAAKQWSFNYPLTLMLSGLSLAGVLWLGGYQVLTGRITLGTLVAFERYTTLLNEPIRWLGFVVNRIARALASAERIFEILDTKPAITDRAGATPIAAMQGEVRFERVGFRYAGASGGALHGVDFTAAPGQVVALVGPTGSGKSTVTNLIPRFYDATDGRILIDGRDVRELTLASLRRHIGIVLQETFLFSVTIRENIAYG
nr:ABC transporter ATP-binding protein [Chloroflexia bacterium]